MNSELKLRIFDMEYGLREYENIEYIRLVSDTYNLLIMKDYLPIIGEVDGKINIKGKDIDMTLDNVKAFYMNSDNVFNLMIKEG
jgi:hypothetical protein